MTDVLKETTLSSNERGELDYSVEILCLGKPQSNKKWFHVTAAVYENIESVKM